MENFNSQSTQFDISFKKYIKQISISIFNKDNVIGKENIEDLICPICFNVLIQVIKMLILFVKNV